MHVYMHLEPFGHIENNKYLLILHDHIMHIISRYTFVTYIYLSQHYITKTFLCQHIYTLLILFSGYIVFHSVAVTYLTIPDG